jgi:uncharacterized protein (DUF302 family)
LFLTACNNDDYTAIAPKFLGMTEQEEVDEFLSASDKAEMFARLDADASGEDREEVLVAAADSAITTDAVEDLTAETAASSSEAEEILLAAPDNTVTADAHKEMASESSESSTAADLQEDEPLLLATAEEHTGSAAKEHAGSAAEEQPATPMQSNPHAMMPSSGMGNPYAMMNPMMGGMGYPNMMNPMMMPMFNPMAMMGPMMNPQMHGYMMNMMTNMMMNPTVDGMTSTQTLDSMMRMMDPKVALAMMGGTYEQREDDDVPDVLPVARIPGFPTQTYRDQPKNTVSPSISDEAKKNAFQTMLMMSPLSVRDMLSMMAYKLPLEEGVTWDDAVDSMMVRANEVNFKFVGSSPMYKEIEALTGEPTPRLEIFRFCDALVAREILDYMPEFIIFLPCQIALIEDAEGQLWVMTMDWDISWLDFAQNPNSHLPKKLRADAKRIREDMRYIMEGAASGDL